MDANAGTSVVATGGSPAGSCGKDRDDVDRDLVVLRFSLGLVPRAASTLLTLAVLPAVGLAKLELEAFDV